MRGRMQAGVQRIRLNQHIDSTIGCRSRSGLNHGQRYIQ